MSYDESATYDLLSRWSRFFAAETDEELAAAVEGDAMLERAKHALTHLSVDPRAAEGDPMLQKAKYALAHLSADPRIQEMAQKRRVDRYFHELAMKLARDEGHKEGLELARLEKRQKARIVGRTKALAGAVLAVLRARSLAFDADLEVKVTSCTDPEVLKTWLKRAPAADNASSIFDRP